LGKDISVVRDDRGYPVIRDRSPFSNSLSQSDHGWNRAGFFLTWPPSRGHLASPRITLICFGAPPSLRQRFENIVLPSKWQEALSDPYCLFVAVLNDLFLQVDGILWSLASVFRRMELVGEPRIDRWNHAVTSHEILMPQRPLCRTHLRHRTLSVSTMWPNTSSS
jgi:hypothetical protein